jgi:cell division protease FtsH
MKIQNKRPTPPTFSYLLPYLMMAAAVLTFVWLVFFSNPLTSTAIPATNLGEFLMTENVETVTTTERETITTVTGTYINEEGATVYFTATFETSNTFVKDAVDEALTLRIDGEGEYYYATRWTTNNAFESSWFDAWGPTILVVGGSALIFMFLFSRMNNSVNSSNNKAMEFNKSRARREDNSKVKFADVAGADEEKAELVEMVEYLRNPSKYTKLGAKLPKGVLLVGPPGTGKTLLAKAVAGEAGVPFYSISGSDFVEMFVGVGAGRVRDMFKRAKQTAPCLIFIDEIDAVGRQRGAGMGGGNDEREQTLNQLLVELDGFADNSGIIVIAATNRDDVLDPALLRAGRFDRQITVNLPDRAGREAIFKVHSKNKKIDASIDFSAISKRTVGFSGADIANIMNEAAILAVRNNREVVILKDVDEAIDRRIAGPAKSSKGMSEHEREVVAYHEAGHAVIGLNLKFSDKVQKITIVPRGRTGGHVLMTPEEDRFLMTKNQLNARIIGYLGGRTSEEIFFGDVSTGAQNDIEVATRIARMMVTEYGMSALGPIQYESNTGSVFLGRDYNSTQKNFSTQVAFEIDKEVRSIIDHAHEEARKILIQNKDQVIMIAKTLLEKETITSEEIAALTNPSVKVEEAEAVVKKVAARKKKVKNEA